MKNRRFLPEGPSGLVLESRALLSTVPHAIVSAEATSIAGAVSGTYTEKTAKDGSEAVALKAKEKIAGMPVASVTGTIHAGSTGTATGTVRIATKGGAIKLSLVGPAQTGTSTLSGLYTYDVTAASGKFATQPGSGTIDLTLTPVGKATSTASHGKFTAVVS